MQSEAFPFTSQEIDHLESLLFDNDQEEENLDLFGIHGLLSAFAVGPADADVNEWLRLILDGSCQLESQELEEIKQSILRLFKHIEQQLHSEENVSVPEEIFDDEDALANWSAGFIEGFLSNEKLWFEGYDEAAVASLLLPMMAHSELFEDEDFEDIKHNDKLMAEMADQIPENLTDLYLLYHAKQ
ncbi:YecA family protein [Hahella sp. CR1]|uniref:YecA/YgfB family protein n=1 Tax=unclassified Hahella TaxID=2624107 RepID=UPI0024437046|nr:YecA family protein [Hahella sp. CR1]MDG9667467.1 YecA family protein [Hahella sp. CR1]